MDFSEAGCAAQKAWLGFNQSACVAPWMATSDRNITTPWWRYGGLFVLEKFSGQSWGRACIAAWTSSATALGRRLAENTQRFALAAHRGRRLGMGMPTPKQPIAWRSPRVSAG